MLKHAARPSAWQQRAGRWLVSLPCSRRHRRTTQQCCSAKQLSLLQAANRLAAIVVALHSTQWCDHLCMPGSTRLQLAWEPHLGQNVFRAEGPTRFAQHSRTFRQKRRRSHHVPECHSTGGVHEYYGIHNAQGLAGQVTSASTVAGPQGQCSATCSLTECLPGPAYALGHSEPLCTTLQPARKCSCA